MAEDLAPFMRTQAEKRQAIVHLDHATRALKTVADELALMQRAAAPEFARIDGMPDLVFDVSLTLKGLANDLHDEINAIAAYLDDAAQRDLERRFAEDMPDRAVIPFRPRLRAVSFASGSGTDGYPQGAA